MNPQVWTKPDDGSLEENPHILVKKKNPQIVVKSSILGEIGVPIFMWLPSNWGSHDTAETSSFEYTSLPRILGIAT